MIIFDLFEDNNEKSQGVAEGSLEEIDRRGFLKGMGAAAVAGAAGYKLGQPTSDNSVYKNPKVVFLLGYLEGCKEYITPGKDALEINTLIRDYLSYTKGDATKLWTGSDQFFHDVGVYNKQHSIGEPGYTQVFPNDQEQKAWIQSQAKEALNQLRGLIQQQKESVNQGVAEGSEHEGLVLQFLKSITPKELRYYSIRDNCGPAALHMMDWAKEKGIELHRVNGYFVADNVVYDKADFTKEMKHEFLQQGLDFNDPKSRQEFIASNPKYSKEWKKVPHYWLQDDQGTVYDPTGYIQFIKTGLAKDLDKSRYETVQGVAEELSEEFDLIESIIDQIADQNGVDSEVVWDDLESLTEDELYAFAVTSQLNEDWQKVNKQDKTDGMSKKAVNSYRREHPGSKLKTAVTTKPSKLKRGSKASKRRSSYCSRSKGQMKMHNISCAKTPDKAICKARRRWNC